MQTVCYLCSPNLLDKMFSHKTRSILLHQKCLVHKWLIARLLPEFPFACGFLFSFLICENFERRLLPVAREESYHGVAHDNPCSAASNRSILIPSAVLKQAATAGQHLFVVVLYFSLHAIGNRKWLPSPNHTNTRDGRYWLGKVKDQ